ncbi:MAG: DUF554 domain-containing protein [Chloroflexi bacterium]|nr:DUF554 domain-containing protein [Chloroflexota bacterium]
MTGTILNAITVIIGGTLGTLLGSRLPENMRQSVLHGLGLVTLVVGIGMTRETQNILIVMFSVLLGAILGEWWRIEERLNALGDAIKARVAMGTGGTSTFTEGFVVASLVFCVGPMTILGSIQDGLTGDYHLLAIKSVLDGFAALAFSSSLGVGVVFAAVTVLVYQGSLSLLAGLAQTALTQPMIAEMTATGGVLIMGIGLLLLDIKRLRLSNFLPAIFIAPLLVALLNALGIPVTF